jgi:SnoaL-like domain
MSDESVTRDLFDRWERVWRDGRYDLVPSCVADRYIRHEETGDRVVTPETYAAELENMRKERPGIRVLVYDHAFKENRAWFRFGFTWSDPKSGEPRSRAGMQSYRIMDGKLAETWMSMQPMGSKWPDAEAQEHWTSPPPIK